MAAPLDIPLRRNEDWSRTFKISDAEGAPIDITGCTFALHVRSRSDNAALITQADVDVTDAENGEFTVTLSAVEGSPLNAYGSPLQTENLPYDLRVTDPEGNKLDLTAGVVVLSRGVTHV